MRRCGASLDIKGHRYGFFVRATEDNEPARPSDAGAVRAGGAKGYMARELFAGSCKQRGLVSVLGGQSGTEVLPVRGCRALRLIHGGLVIRPILPDETVAEAILINHRDAKNGSQ